MSDTDNLISEIEATAWVLGLSPSTIAERAGQGGKFYARLTAGKRSWPETVAKVRASLEAQLSHAGKPGLIQVVADHVVFKGGVT